MAYLKSERYDYFLIWGNGLRYKREILDVIRNEESLKILKIMRHQPKSVAKLVRAIYSYDYAPLPHLKSKTRYLLKTEPDVLFIFVRNQNVQEVYRGKGAFRHIECDYIKSIKEEIRDKFNPRQNGQRTEEHVVHASDNESQVDYVLKYLGFQKGLGYLKKVPNPVLSLPHYLPKFDKFSVQCVEVSQLYCTLVRGSQASFWVEIVELGQMPQYACLTGDTEAYQKYLSKFLGNPLTCNYSVENLLILSRNFTYLEGAHATSYILVRPLQPHQYLILDGVHRAAVLKSRGVENFPVAVVG